MKRILLKLSGEALAGEKKTGFDEETVRKVALQVKELVDDGIQVGIVIGGGNFWKGVPVRTLTVPGRPDRNAGYDHELYLCLRDFPFRRHDDQYPDTF